MHDFDDDNHLDGIELSAALRHVLEHYQGAKMSKNPESFANRITSKILFF